MTAIDLGRIGAMRRNRVPYAALHLLLIVSFFLSLGLGAVGIAPLDIVSIFGERLGLPALTETEARDGFVLIGIRLPRVVLAMLVGGGLAMAGAALQGLFRNPLADPALLGVSSGAALAVAATIVFGGGLIAMLPVPLRPWALPAAAFAGAMLVTALIYGFVARRPTVDVTILLLAGIAINAIAGAGLGLATFLSEDQQLRDITFWLLGRLSGVGWIKLLPVAVMIGIGLVWMLCLARPLNAILLGEREAFQIGFDVEPIKRQLILVTALASGAAVALTGMIGFVGLLVPHLARMLVGADHRRLLPTATILGASLLLLADLVARLVVLPAELPIGVVTSFIGAPFFLWLLLRRRGGV